jgi:hypothetical protein
MECVQDRQTINRVELLTPSDIEKRPVLQQKEVYDKKAAELRRYLASENAIRQLESRKNLSSIAVRGLSFNR